MRTVAPSTRFAQSAYAYWRFPSWTSCFKTTVSVRYIQRFSQNLFWRDPCPSFLFLFLSLQPSVTHTMDSREVVIQETLVLIAPFPYQVALFDCLSVCRYRMPSGPRFTSHSTKRLSRSFTLLSASCWTLTEQNTPVVSTSVRLCGLFESCCFLSLCSCCRRAKFRCCCCGEWTCQYPHVLDGVWRNGTSEYDRKRPVRIETYCSWIGRRDWREAADKY